MPAATLMEVWLGSRRFVMMMGVVEEERLTGEHEEVAAVGPRQDIRIEDERGRPVGHDAPVHGEHPREAPGRAGQVVGRGDDRLATPGLRLEEVHEVLLRRRVDPGDRLVEEEQIRLGRKRPGQEDAAPLTTRQPSDLGIRLGGHADLLEGCSDRPAIVAAGSSDRTEGGIAAHHDDVPHGDREPPVDELGLGDIGHPARLLACRMAEHLDAAGHRRQEPGHEPQQGALAGAVRPDDREQRARLDGEVDPLEGDAIAVAGGDPAQPDIGMGPGMPRVDAGIDRCQVMGGVVSMVPVGDGRLRSRDQEPPSAAARRSTSQRIIPS